MKKILSLLCLLMLAISSAWAGEVFTFDLGASPGTSTPSGFFTHGDKWNFNSKFNGAEYDGKSYSNGLKMEGATVINFTTTKSSKVTIVQSTWSANTIKFDGVEQDVSLSTTPAGSTGCRVYTITGVEAGTHSITRGSGESGIFYVEVRETSTTGISTVKTKADEADSPIYNLAGQKVNENYKGVVIKDGKKMIQK